MKRVGETGVKRNPNGFLKLRCDWIEKDFILVKLEAPTNPTHYYASETILCVFFVYLLHMYLLIYSYLYARKIYAKIILP